ncbi:brachyurin [Tribolium castaneum]|uniref:Serine protease P128 n=1 Tax=Tribolium castaneum TaxID=7070 RepID=D6WZJ7_TRICA|nr:PREDICTED: brachyurin-like [Tribolium castaneum]EFA10698.1 serine protease P128 [Tribolium castaneum]|eukprot:XP_008198155.2 PREDICTED: brachyurin-like [Tribolium castaneum]
MKTIILFLTITALAAAFPKTTKLHYRNLYKPPISGETKHKPNPRIIGGHEAIPHSIPYQAFLEIYADGEAYYCGGSLISQNYVLTAAHCGVGVTEALVTLGAHKVFETEDTQVKITSKEIKVHEEYDDNLIVNDIAVIKLPQPVNLTDSIKTVALPNKTDVNNTFVGTTARISGWGLTSGFGDVSKVLLYVDVNVITNIDCGNQFDEDFADSVLCTSGDQETGSCNGDSGGPLVVDGVQIGVVSFGVMWCLPGYPSGFTRITSFLDWIATNSDVVIN